MCVCIDLFRLDAKQMITLTDCMGSDLTVVNAARVSMGKHTDILRDEDIRLIRYLAKNKHITPFFHPQIQLRIKMPIFIARQWWRHVVGFSRNEISRRYVSDEPEFFYPDYLRPSDKNIKQGSVDVEHPTNEHWKRKIEETYKYCKDVYNSMMADGVCPEQARMILPQGMMTEFIETGSLYAYARLYLLRIKPDSQKEIRAYAEKIGDTLSKLFPYSWDALTHD